MTKVNGIPKSENNIHASLPARVIGTGLPYPEDYCCFSNNKKQFKALLICKKLNGNAKFFAIKFMLEYSNKKLTDGGDNSNSKKYCS